MKARKNKKARCQGADVYDSKACTGKLYGGRQMCAMCSYQVPLFMIVGVIEGQ